MRAPLPLILLISAVIPASAQVSSWWYPMGSIEATRYNPARTSDTALPVVKWKTSALRDSPSLLVGALRPEPDGRQQVFGQHGNELRVLRSDGFLETSRLYSNLFGPDYRLTLTGLFNVDAATPLAAGRANALGLGVERTQDAAGSRLFAALADEQLKPFQLLRISPLEPDPVPGNMNAGIYPVAVYHPSPADSPVAIVIVSQDFYTGQALDTMINGLRQFPINRGAAEVSRRWSYPMAPRPYVQAPAMAVDPTDNALLLTPALGTYSFSPPRVVTHTDPRRLQTSSDATYAITLRVDEPAEDVIETRPIPQLGSARGEVHPYYVRLSRNQSDPGALYQLVTENHSDAQPGQARIYLRLFRQSATTQLGLYENPAMTNIGWSIITADLDGTDRAVPRPRPGMVENRGLEIVAARRRIDGGAIDTNRLFLLRYNDTLINDARFGVYAEQAIRGQIMAAGDLVLDTLNKDEIVIADRNVLRILRFRRFADELMLGDNPSFFETLNTFTLDAEILRVAIADLENDGANDLIVTTRTSTYAIGRAVVDPLGPVVLSSRDLCLGDSLELRWDRKVGGGDAGIVIIAEDLTSGELDTLESAYRPDTAQRYTVRGDRLRAGTYRLRLMDRDVPSVADTTLAFTVQPVFIAEVNVPGGVSGTLITATTEAGCADSVQLEFSFDESQWQTVGAAVPVASGAASSLFSVPCPTATRCGDTDVVRVWYRFSTPDGQWHSPPRSSTIAPARAAISVETVGTAQSRTRLLRWRSDEFACDTLVAAVSLDGGATWDDLALLAAAQENGTVDVPGELEQDILLRLCCPSTCGVGISGTHVSEIGEADFIAPNPFDPDRGGESGATIIFRLAREGTIDITIFDASRAVVRDILDGESMRSGLHRASWDGRNSNGEIVADGAYICVISSSSGERIVLPVSIAKR